MTTHLDASDLRNDLLLAQVDACRMIAAARASVAAHLRGDPNPVAWIEAELDRRGLLPAAGADPLQVIAEPAPRGLLGVHHHGPLRRLLARWKTRGAARFAFHRALRSLHARTVGGVRPPRSATGSGTPHGDQRAEDTATGRMGELVGGTDLS